MCCYLEGFPCAICGYTQDDRERLGDLLEPCERGCAPFAPRAERQRSTEKSDCPAISAGQDWPGRQVYLGLRTCSVGRACKVCKIWAWCIWGVVVAATVTMGTLLTLAALLRR